MNTMINLSGNKNRMISNEYLGRDENLLIELEISENGNLTITVVLCNDEDEWALSHAESVERLKAEGYTHLIAHPLSKALEL